MKFQYLWVLNLLLLIPLVIFLMIIENRKRKNQLSRFAEPHLLSLLTQTGKKSVCFFKSFLLTLAIALIIIGIAGPKWGSHYQDVIRKGVDIIFLLDVSKSMDVQDVKPSRLKRAKREIVDFLKVTTGDRIGLILFAGNAFVQCPLTLDYDALSMFIESIDTDTIPASGTDMGKGIKLCIDSFDYKTATDKVVVMVTDGEDNEGGGLKQSVKAEKKNIKIFIYGIGEPQGAPVPDEKGGFLKDKNENLIFSKLNEETLIRIASTTGGEYVRSVTGDLDLDRLYFDGIRQKTEAKELESGKIKIYEERFYIFIGLALFCLLIIELLNSDLTKKIVPLAVVLLLVFSFAKNAASADSGDKLYKEGKFKEAEDFFLKKDIQNPKDVRFRYNKGCAAFKNTDYKSASSAFESVLKRTKDKKISAKASYNLGNSFFMLGDYEKAAEYFKESLKIDSEDKNARYNYDLALKAAKEAKKKQQETSDDKNNKENKNNKNKDSQKESNKEKPSDEMKNKENQQKDNSSKSENNDTNDEKNNENKDMNSEQPPDEQEGNKEPARDENKKYNMDKKEAQAFFDNITEDPSDINKFRFKKSDIFPASGKNW